MNLNFCVNYIGWLTFLHGQSQMSTMSSVHGSFGIEIVMDRDEFITTRVK